MYEDGHGGLPEDHAQAVEWYRKAVEQGFASAQWQLGKMFRAGKGVPRDYVQAYSYFMAAEVNGRSYAQLDKKAVAKKMTPDEIEEAKRLAKEWIEKYQAR